MRKNQNQDPIIKQKKNGEERVQGKIADTCVMPLHIEA